MMPKKVEHAVTVPVLGVSYQVLEKRRQRTNMALASTHRRPYLSTIDNDKERWSCCDSIGGTD